MKLIKTAILGFVGLASTLTASPYTTVYETSRGPHYVPATEHMEQAPSNIQASYKGRLYDSYGYLENGVYYQTQPVRGSNLFDWEKVKQQWPE
jgi:hypothetical protein